MKDLNHLPDIAPWERIPDAPETLVRAFVPAPSTRTGNAFILSAPEAVAVIDPGADPAIASDIHDEVHALTSDVPRPLYILLTHCHIDHYKEAARLTDDDILRARLMCHAAGIATLAKRDAHASKARAKRMDVPAFGSVTPLFADGGPAGTSRTMHTSGGDLAAMAVPLGGNETLHIYHTPGHSRDSLCFRMGGALFTGDTLCIEPPDARADEFSPQPDRAVLPMTYQKLLWIMDTNAVTTVYPGHGPVLTQQQARMILTARLATLDAPRPTR